MTEPEPTGYREHEAPDADSGDDPVDATPGSEPSDRGELDTVLTTDDEAQRDDPVTRPGNTSD